MNHFAMEFGAWVVSALWLRHLSGAAYPRVRLRIALGLFLLGMLTSGWMQVGLLHHDNWLQSPWILLTPQHLAIAGWAVLGWTLTAIRLPADTFD